MIILIPIGGLGTRFKKLGYENPKALIKVCNKEIIFYLIDNLIESKKFNDIDFIYIPYNKEYLKYEFESVLKNKYSNVKFKFLPLEKDTDGAAETIFIALSKLEVPDSPVLCLDSDNFYQCDIIKKWNGKNSIFTFLDKSSEGKFSYVKGDNEITDIVEKEKISNYANCGGYGFESYKMLIKYCDQIISKNIRQKNEFYTSGVIKLMIDDKITFYNINIKNKDYFSLGTPEQVEEFESPYLFDLDGTLVNTDDVYAEVWDKILDEYNLSIDSNFFNFFIQGKNDVAFLKYLMPTISNSEIEKISMKKDKLFVDLLKQSKKDIMTSGAFDFIEKNKNRRMAIVTSCNKIAAEFISEKTEIKDYMQFIIASEDCINHKPHPEPYERASKLLNCKNNLITIFEDSNSGYKSAKNFGTDKICLIIHDNSSDYVRNSDEYKIEDYNNFDITKITKDNEKVKVTELVKQKLHYYPIRNVTLNEKDLKTGYICDIKSLTLNFIDLNQDVVLKISNNDNDLSDIAKKINLYDNETFFYKKLSKIVNLPSPQFFCHLNIENRDALILEDLNIYNGSFNLDLNDNIDLILEVTNQVSNMHNRFLFEEESEVLDLMREVSKMKDIEYYKKLVNERFDTFIKLNRFLLNESDISLLTNIYKIYEDVVELCSEFPLSFCHGDMKSPNIFYKNDKEPIFLDWQYIQLNKGISDITFLLTESTNFNPLLNDLVLKYYYKKSKIYESYDELLFDFKLTLSLFPFFVMVWFNSENRDNLIDKVFPINFMKNVLKFYNEYLDDDFFQLVNKKSQYDLSFNDLDVKLGVSVLSSDLSNLKNECNKIIESGADYLHLDIMDGNFVDNLTFGTPLVNHLRKHNNAFLDCHLMVNDPKKYVNELIKIKVNRISFHIESVNDPSDLINLIKSNNIECGIAVNPETDVDKILNYVSKIDNVLIMTVDPGFGGQKINEKTFNKITLIRSKFPNINIQVDGGVNKENVSQLVNLGANLIVSGSALLENDNLENNLKEFKRRIKSNKN